MAMLLFVMSMTALTSCNKEKTNLIVGKWECTTATYTEAGVTQSVPWVIGMVWEFKSDGTIISNSIDIDDEEIEVSATYVVTAQNPLTGEFCSSKVQVLSTIVAKNANTDGSISLEYRNGSYKLELHEKNGTLAKNKTVTVYVSEKLGF